MGKDVCVSLIRLHTYTQRACMPAVARVAFISGPWLVGKCSFPCRSSDSHSLWRTQHSLFLFSPTRLFYCCTFSCPSSLSPACALPLSSSPPLPVMPVVSNYHGSVFPQPLHYIQAVITVYLQHLLPLLRPHFNRNNLFYMAEMTILFFECVFFTTNWKHHWKIQKEKFQTKTFFFKFIC